VSTLISKLENDFGETMNISRTIPTQTTRPANPERKAAQKAFEDAHTEFENYADQLTEARSSYESYQQRNLLIGAGVGLAAGIGAMWYFGVSPTHGAELAAPAILGGVVSAGISYVTRGGEAKRLQPKVSESFEKMDSSREAFREELLKEMDDQGVRDVSDTRWEEQKAKSYFRSTGLYDHIGALTSLADNRLSSGWNSELANSQDDPEKFLDQKAFIVDNPEVQRLIEK
jgi:hypothetical protein